MNRMNDPQLLIEYLNHGGHTDLIYKAMEDNDLSAVVMTVLETLNRIGLMPPLMKQLKSEMLSNSFREQGNTAYKANRYKTALVTYNLALAHAPLNSLAMKRAYYNKSSVLYITENYTECLKDIEICLSLDYKVENLNIRKEGCLNKIKLKFKGVIPNGFIKDFFKFEICRNPHIPCASADIDVVWKPEGPKVIAAKDIVAGTVVALETAFVSRTHFLHTYMSCSYCQKTSLNLIPCDTCHYLMFCSTDCKKNCLKEYHLVECEFIDLVMANMYGTLQVLSIRLAIKLRNKFDSWEEFIATSNDIGQKRFNSSTINEIYDGNNKYSSFAWKDTELNILYGKIYNFSLLFAAVIHYLAAIPSYYPEDVKERKMAMRSMARVMMYFQMLNPYVLTVQAVTNTEPKDVDNAYFPFISKLTKSCDSNLLGVALDNKMALIAINCIQKGAELTFNRYHWMEFKPITDTDRVTTMYRLFYYLCKCCICLQNWDPMKAPSRFNTLSKLQKKRFLDLSRDTVTTRNLRDKNIEEVHFKKLCNTIDILSNFQFSKEYAHVFNTFLACLHSLKLTHTDNKFLKDDQL